MIALPLRKAKSPAYRGTKLRLSPEGPTDPAPGSSAEISRHGSRKGRARAIACADFETADFLTADNADHAEQEQGAGETPTIRVFRVIRG